MNDKSEDKTDPRTPEAAPPARPSPSADQKANALKWFAHAKKAAETRNYDYAIQLYVNGLEVWPDAVEEGLKPLRVVGTARRLARGKPAGFLAARRLPTTGKDAHKNLNNALHLYGLDPSNINLMEQILQLSAQVLSVGVVRWMGPVLTDAFSATKRLSESRYAKACKAMDAGADFAIDSGQDEAAKEILQAYIATTQIWGSHYPNSAAAQKARSDATSKQTIVKGRFASAEGFTESLRDADLQHELHDMDKSAHSEERTRELIRRAREEWESHRNVPSKLLRLVDTMLRLHDESVEREAIDLLEKEHAATNDYIFRLKADDIQMMLLGRRRRQLAAEVRKNPGDPAARSALDQYAAQQAETEVRIFQGRVEQYPSDMRIRFLLANRLFAAGRVDDAIPLLQQAQIDGRCRLQCRLYLGRCFHEKGFFDQAAAVLRKGIEESESTSSTVYMELNYWLARTLEAAGQTQDAVRTYGFLIEHDYNYLDARQRLEKLVSGT